ncbi:MAG TPA: nucleotidyltransferase domain-containing protein [Gaiellaceae bacterium]
MRELARRVVDAALDLGPLRAALLVGSAARGDADFYSDLDLLLFVDELPPPGRLDALREAVGGTNPVQIDGDKLVQFDVDGIATQVGYTTVAEQEEHLDRLLDRCEEIGSPYQKLLVGVLEGLALHGDDLVEGWRARAAAYPEPLRRAAIEHHWHFFPLWHYGDALAARDAELWRLDMLLEAAFNLLGVLAALNRVYFTRFQLKHTRSLVAKLTLAPPQLADRLERLFRLPAEEAATELGRLVVETRELVAAELPDLDLPLRREPGERLEPWGR